MQSRNPERNIKIIDISHHQKSIDWLKVKADGVKGVLIKATEGVGYIDDMFRQHVNDARYVGLQVGFYHYARPETGNTAQAEAASFLAAVKDLPAKLPYVLDLEGDAKNIGIGRMTDWAWDWLDIVQASGHPVMLYTGAYYAQAYCGKNLAKFPLWVAHYGVNTPMANSVWDRWDMFQYTSSGRVSGIAGNVDINEMERDVWMELTQGKSPFKDVPANHWAAGVIGQAKDAGIVSGYPDGTFKPDQPITRAEAVALVMAARGGE